MKRTLVYLCLMLWLMNCKSDEVFRPVKNLYTDPASFIEGVYVGDFRSDSIGRIGIEGSNVVLVKRLASHRIGLHSLLGQMTPYKIEIVGIEGKIYSKPSQPLLLDVALEKDEPSHLYINQPQGYILKPKVIALRHFGWSKSPGTPPFRPLAIYRGANSGSSLDLLSRLTGFYTGYGDVYRDLYKETRSQGSIVAIRRKSGKEIEVVDFQQFYNPLTVTLSENEKAEEITATSADGQVKVSIWMDGQQPKRIKFVNQPGATAAGNHILSFEWNRDKPFYNSAYVPL